MATQPTGGFRGFVQKPLGKVFLLLLSFAAVAAVFYADPIDAPFLGIPVFLVVGLALPIIWGMKRPRILAASALVVLLVLAPVVTVIYTDIARSPVPSACSMNAGTASCAGSVMQNATLSPFAADAGTNFTWKVTVYPTNLPTGLRSTNWSNDSLLLYISTCPGRNDPNFTNCDPSSPLLVLNHTFGGSLTVPVNVTFNRSLDSQIFWTWQMDLRIQNATSHKYTPFLLAGNLQASWIQGPVVGSYGSVYGALVGDIYLLVFLYLALPFYALLLLYMLLKGRERRRQEAMRRAQAAPKLDAGLGPSLPSETTPSGEDSPRAGPGPIAELRCPKCQAVVYPSESKCWKCGAGLTAPPSSEPSAG